MGVMAGAIIGAGALAAGAGIYGATEASSAQRASAASARRSQKLANDTNYQEFLQSRGSGGSAFLPMYLKQNGSLFESQLGSNLIGAYNQSTPNYGDIFSATSRMNQGVSGATGLARNLFNGGVTDTMLGNLAPVAKARVAFSRQSALDSLNKTLQQIGAVQASKGYSGDSYGNSMLRFGANLQGQNQIAGANLSNLEDIKNIRDQYGTLLPLQNINLPFQMQQSAGYSAVAPQSIYANSILNSLQPLSFLKIGTGNPPTSQPMPVSGPIPGTGQLIAQGVGQLAGTGMNLGLQYLQQQQLQQQQQQMQAQMEFYNGYNGPSGGAWGTAGTGSDLGYLSSLNTTGVSPSGFDYGSGAGSLALA